MAGDTRHGMKRKRLGYVIVSIIVAVLMALFDPDYALSQSIDGVANVRDGDTLVIDGQKIRLQGIDAPELHQTCNQNQQSYPCGRQSKQQLKQLTDGMIVRCEIAAYDKYQRALGHCFVGEMNLNAQMVASGHALAYTHYSKRYLLQEIQSRQKRVGIHAGTYVTPWQWRRTHPRSGL
jgi:endonuclease YncB( thermonuclease family)